MSSPVTELPIVEIEKLSQEGRGIARIEGKVCFIDGALPGEKVRIRYQKKKRDFDEASIVDLLQPSPQRVNPPCAHFGRCGGCSLQHIEVSAQLALKESHFLELLQRTTGKTAEQRLEPLQSEVWHYRNKARLSTRYVEKKSSLLLGFREKQNPRYITEMDHCPILHPGFDQELPRIRELITSFVEPKNIAQVELAAGDNAVALIFRNMQALAPSDEQALKAFAIETGFRIFLQPAGPDSVQLFYPEDGQSYLEYALPEQGLQLAFHPSDFTQVNAGINRKMVKQALALLDLGATDRVLDLFCGLGNFSLPLAQKAASVVGIEGSEAMVQRASMNARRNGIQNCEFYSHNLDEAGTPEYLASFKANTLLLDPPRSGAYTIVKGIDKLAIERLVYVSCNTASFVRDADVLINQQGYTLKAAGVMDMFPHTAHLESMALFER